ncbi:MAG: AIR carboxylase family protein [Spirochaetales bacterium]|nr:AIR carboxylase family protein [Spirochaetales bacterium]
MKDICIILGSKSDEEQIQPGIDLCEEKKLSYECHVYSAHRNLDELISFLSEREKDFKVIIACAGLSAALPGVVAAKVKLPVIGVPLVAGPLSGIDALLSIVQLPKGIPAATMGLGKQGILNAVYFAERIVNLTKNK